MMDWQDISTAPDNGTQIDLWAAERERYVNERVTDCWWNGKNWVHTRTIYDDDTGNDEPAILFNAEFWRPIPAPPSIP